MLLLSFLCTLAILAIVAHAQLPTFPDNIVVFPERDYVNALGFNGASRVASYTGKKVQVQIVRSVNGVSSVVGEAFPTVTGRIIAFDINHPFGYCWGAGSKYQVTPEIVAGDQVLLKVDGLQIASSTVLNAKITSKTLSQNVITVQGTGVSSLPNPTFMECRIVQPALVSTIVGRRDVRAIPGGNFANGVGYASSLVTNGDAFTCTWTFFDAANGPSPVLASSAFTGMFSVSSWQFADAAGNAQGLTISEFESAGGPMDGTCPPSATSVAPVAPSAIAYDGTKAYWNAASNVPGATYSFNYYSVEALRPTVANAAISTINGYRTNSNTQSIAFSTPLATNDVLQVRAWGDFPTSTDILSTAKKLSFVATNVAAPKVPTFSAANNAAVSTVTLTSADGVQLAYTITTGTVGVAPVLGAANTLIYGGTPIDITGTKTIVAVAFDSAGHKSASATSTFVYNTPSQVTAVTAFTTGLSKITVAWAPYTASTVTGYKIYYAIGNTKTLVRTVTAATPYWADVSVGLRGGVSYSFVVTAINVVNGVTYEGAVSDLSTPAVFLQGLTDNLVFTSKLNANELRVDGTGSIDGAVVNVFDAATKVLLGSTTVSAGSFAIRVRPVANSVTSIDIVSSFGFSALNMPTA